MLKVLFLISLCFSHNIFAECYEILGKNTCFSGVSKVKKNQGELYLRFSSSVWEEITSQKSLNGTLRYRKGEQRITKGRLEILGASKCHVGLFDIYFIQNKADETAQQVIVHSANDELLLVPQDKHTLDEVLKELGLFRLVNKC